MGMKSTNGDEVREANRVRNEEEDRYRFFYADRCVLCGECLSRCPELRLTAERAREEKARLNRGEPGAVLSRSCTSCFDCNFYCPHRVNPCDQIVHHWWREYRRKGLLERARYFLPLEPLNFIQNLEPLAYHLGPNTVAGKNCYLVCFLLFCHFFTLFFRLLN